MAQAHHHHHHHYRAAGGRGPIKRWLAPFGLLLSVGSAVGIYLAAAITHQHRTHPEGPVQEAGQIEKNYCPPLEQGSQAVPPVACSQQAAEQVHGK